ncbi:hypothetical protein F2P81_017668 [Scophthalmus maximus]|uniref:Uncharacterized protein n=1 Tax=Scophthalmus maximus TaxID=52904 RepID=A0A6A4SCK0_SCOMX|nr:hypothetical protein F2P81_017668 [Scophthalmus maximus]
MVCLSYAKGKQKPSVPLRKCEETEVFPLPAVPLVKSEEVVFWTQLGQKFIDSDGVVTLHHRVTIKTLTNAEECGSVLSRAAQWPGGGGARRGRTRRSV